MLIYQNRNHEHAPEESRILLMSAEIWQPHEDYLARASRLALEANLERISWPDRSSLQSADLA